MLFKKSTKRAVKQFTKARAELQAVVDINHDKMHKSHLKDKSDVTFVERMIAALNKWKLNRKLNRESKRAACRAEINEANAWLDALPKIKK